jgi:hypothetical protein
MGRTAASREAWHPQSEKDREAVLRELHEVVASPHFCSSKRYPALLQYIVEMTLAGKSEVLKERTLGIEVFDRAPTYDTNTDTVVRYTAGEVRKRLQLHYSERDHNPEIRISLPPGSYVPEFLHGHDEPEAIEESAGFAGTHFPDFHSMGDAANPVNVGQHNSEFTASRLTTRPTASDAIPAVPPAIARFTKGRVLWVALAVAVLAISFVALRYHTARPQSAVNDFWGPVFRDQHTILICTGGVIFQQNGFSGVITAGKDNEYPFVSMQIASAIAQISSLVEHAGATTQVLPSPSTPLTELRDHSVVLLGGYNNRWAMNLLQPQRFQFTPEPVESIVDRMQPQVHWARNRTLPYASADDYAIVARFRDATTGSWVVVLAGLGRNGTEAAAQFVTSPEYMKMLMDKIGRDLSDRNIEVVLGVRVIEGKTGAPSILAVHVQ